jgi:hypothetical protein
MNSSPEQLKKAGVPPGAIAGYGNPARNTKYVAFISIAMKDAKGNLHLQATTSEGCLLNLKSNGPYDRQSTETVAQAITRLTGVQDVDVGPELQFPRLPYNPTNGSGSDVRAWKVK